MWQELHLQVENRLDVISGVGTRGDDRAAVDLARHEVPLLVSAVRALLEGHRPDSQGHCRACWRRRRWRRVIMPCRAHVVAWMALLDSGSGSTHAREAV